MNFVKHCLQKRWIRSLAWAAVTLVTIYVLLCTWLNWSWGRQWNATLAMLKAEGETLDFRAVMNDPVSESENFCAIPLLNQLAGTVDNNASKGEPAEKRKHLDELSLPAFRYVTDAGTSKRREDRPRLTKSAELGKASDLKGMVDWLRQEGSLVIPPDSGDPARDVLAALSKHDAAVRELAAGLSRPKAQWTPEWKTRELPDMLFAIALIHYQPIRNLNQTLALRAISAARAGDAVKAHESARIMAKLAQADLNDPFLIGLLVAASDATVLCGSVWELCDAHAGTAEDFARLEVALAALDFHRAGLRACRSEMAAAVNTLQYMRRNPERVPDLTLIVDNTGLPRGSAFARSAMRAVPLGYFDASASVSAEGEFKYLIKPLRDHGWAEASQAAREWEKQLAAMRSQIWRHPTYIMVSLMAPAMTKIASRISYTEALVNKAIIASALERYRIEKGSYPNSLDGVKLANGKPLPLDVMTDRPMLYRTTPSGKYALWSVGPDGKDDGGKRVLDEKRPESTKFDSSQYIGDWVWDFPETNAK